MSVYYNDNDPYVCQWLRNLIAAGHLPEGEVDERDIRYVHPEDVRNFDQVHFFAGIGGWPLALKIAGWHGKVWTGSCPCQPFSNANTRKAANDNRAELWGEFRRLISALRPSVVFGEQVSSPAGRTWLARVSAEMENLSYRFAALDLPAAGVGAPHIRQRLFWVGDSLPTRLPVPQQEELSREGRQEQGRATQQPSDTPNPWWAYRIIRCLDRKDRRISPSIQPLAPRLPGSVGQLRASGNSIVPALAAEFIRSYRDVIKDEHE